MESGIQSSFIPQDAAKPTQAPRRPSTGGLSELIFLISIVLFVASAALAGAVFLYEQYTVSSSTSKSEQLRRAKEAFEPALIHELTRLDDRMRAADLVLSAHIAPLALFDALQQSTLETVSFKSLALEVADSQNIKVKIAGVAEGVNSIALQADLFSKSGVVSNPIFSDINRQLDGVHFNLSALINPAAINYSRLISTAGAAGSFPTQDQQSATPFAPGVQQGASGLMPEAPAQ